ncbi:MAG: hypothetical protein ACK4IZ_08740 [Flavobacterium sp.]|uniref:hypothetical protein n=1 Tax=Flavobacterium sp. TaxID=239 RepID=UPI00391C605C
MFEKKIKNIFINAKNRKSSFGMSLNEILKCLDFEIPKRTFINKHEDLKSLLIIFKNRYLYYEEDEIQEVLKNVIKDKFKNLNSNITEKYTFENFIREVALLNVSHEIRRLLQNNSSLFELFYITKMFDEFEIREYSPIGMQQSDLFKKLNKIVYPEYYQNSNHNIIIEKEKDAFQHQNRDDQKKTSNSLANKLNADEKSFLFYVMCKVIREEKDKKDEFNLPYTELLRLISLIDFYDEKVFSEKYRDSNHYQILSKGLNHFKEEDKLLFLQNLIKNIAEYKLTKTTKYIKQIANKAASLAVLSKKKRNND